VWLALASLCVIDRDHVDGLSTSQGNGAEGAAPPRPTCDNHDGKFQNGEMVYITSCIFFFTLIVDGETLAIINCNVCGNLCGDCDRFLHLHRRTKGHVRVVFKEEEDSIKVDLHEGCGRAKLFWAMALADSLTLKAMVEFRDGGSSGSAATADNALLKADSKPGSLSFTTCRFCGRQSSADVPVMDSLCNDHECAEHAKLACDKVLACGHFCGGIRGESACLPCLHGCSGVKLRQDADDMCMICFTDALSPIPSIQLGCGHIFHYTCVTAILEKRWYGPRITFGFRNCPICKTKIEHDSLRHLLDPIDALFEDVQR